MTLWQGSDLPPGNALAWFLVLRTLLSGPAGFPAKPPPEPFVYRLFAVAFLAVAGFARAAGPAPAESVRIEYLLTVVASLHDAQFIRNGTAYDSTAAVSHMRTKLHAAGSRVKTAEDFVRYCASTSSISGKPYEIRFPDGHVVTSADFLRQKLVEFDKERDGAPN